MLHLRSAALAAALVLAAAAPAFAHAYPKAMDPAPNSSLDAPPTEVVITFTEDIIPQFSTLEVLDSAGKRVDRHDAHPAMHDRARYVVKLLPLTPGTYKVVWRVTSPDTHKTEGSYEFTVTG